MELITDLHDNDLNLMKATELRLGLPGTADEPEEQSLKSNKRSSSEMNHSSDHTDIDTAPASKAQVIGWPPVRSYRKNIFQQKNVEKAEKSGTYVKVSMDGAPYLRKIDLRIYKSYMDLLKSLEIMFKCSINGCCNYEILGCINNRSGEYVPTYQDKDGDWMMVGDVPLDMFVSSCRRMRIMRGSEAKGFRYS